uniref:Uncharacterized protein n=1 Tax=Schizaphis graminum TaxID=13262 RepID=A0A2S2NBS0_SCHGA
MRAVVIPQRCWKLVGAALPRAMSSFIGRNSFVWTHFRYSSTKRFFAAVSDFRRLQRIQQYYRLKSSAMITIIQLYRTAVCDSQLCRIPSRAASECREWTAAARVAATIIILYSLLRYFTIETTTTIYNNNNNV